MTTSLTSFRRTPESILTLTGSGFPRDLLIEPPGVDHVALVRAFGDRIDAVVRRERERERAAFDRVQAYFHRDRHPRRRRCEVGEIHVRAERLLARPVEVRRDRFDARPFHEADEVARREHV